MALMHFPLEQIAEANLRALIDAKTAEARQIEYKREIYGTNDEARREFLADVSSFANAHGGDLLIGVAASKGIPTSLSPLTGDVDGEKLRLDNMARTGLEPRIPNLYIVAVPISAGGAVLVIRVPRSYRAPHRVTFRGANRFWARSSGGRYEPNADELRARRNWLSGCGRFGLRE
jgi:predicted HTH transcriptional regulator